ncbi:MAG: hypothetical protein RL722_1373, partial [Pseudomonadota bacterium]
IAVDPALTARALRLANSAFYGVSGRVASLSDAVHLLGRHTLSTLLTAATVTAQFSGGAALRNHQGFWRHTLGVALVSQTLAASRGLDAEIAFTAGLLHDIGQLALAAYYPDELGAAIALARERDIELVQAELLILGQDHTHVGTLVARHWRLPDSVVEAIAWHHQPSAGLAGAGGHRSAGGTMVMIGPHSPCLADIVHLADAVAHALDLGRAPHELVPELDEAAWDRVGLEVDEAQTLFSYAERGVTALGLALGL